jgi:hypothetical protein
MFSSTEVTVTNSLVSCRFSVLTRWLSNSSCSVIAVIAARSLLSCWFSSMSRWFSDSSYLISASSSATLESDSELVNTGVGIGTGVDDEL